MLAAKRIASALNTRLPSFKRPKCQVEGCDAQLMDPRPFHTEETGKFGQLRVHCLTRCPVCTAEYKGERLIKVGRVTEALSQEFHFYNDDDRAFVTSLLPQFKQNSAKLQEIQAMPVKD